jgi:hypothetical protein
MRMDVPSTRLKATASQAIIANSKRQVRVNAVVDTAAETERRSRGGRPKNPYLHALLDDHEAKLSRGEVQLFANPQKPEQVFWTKLADMLDGKISAKTLMQKHGPYREQVEGWVEKYSLAQLPPAAKDIYSFAEFSLTVEKHRSAELLRGGADEACLDAGVGRLAAALRWSAGFSPKRGSAKKTLLAARIAAACASNLPGSFVIEEISRCLVYLKAWDANENLPDDPAALLRFALARECVDRTAAAREVGLTKRVMQIMMHGSQPTTTQYPKIAKLEVMLKLPKGGLTDRYKALKSPDRREFMRTSDSFGESLKWRMEFPYMLHDWSKSLEEEFDRWASFRCDAVAPYGMKRPLALLSRNTVEMKRTYFAALFGTWSTDMNQSFQIDPVDISMALLVFPRLLHERLKFALERSVCGNGDRDQQFLTGWEVNNIRFVGSLFDEGVGFLRQMPELAARLVPVKGRDGKYLVSKADIARVRRDWNKACHAAGAEYVTIKRNHVKYVDNSRDAHIRIEAILKLPNPLDAFAMLCKGLKAEMLRSGTDASGAETARDVLLAGIQTQCALRKSTLAALNLDHLIYDKANKTWNLRIPRRLFKNKNGPYFRIGKTKNFIPFYEREIEDKYGLYSAIERYLAWGRSTLVGRTLAARTKALFVCRHCARPGLRRGQDVAEAGRMMKSYFGVVLNALTATFVGYDKATGKGIEGVESFGCHEFRAILATGVLKQSESIDKKQEAADAIHDGGKAVEAYLRYVPSDRLTGLKKTIRNGF